VSILPRLRPEIVTDREDVDEANVALMLMESGVGPQNFSIRELQDFHCSISLPDNGKAELNLDSDEALDEFYRDYPDLRAAELELAAFVGEQGMRTPNDCSHAAGADKSGGSQGENTFNCTISVRHTCDTSKEHDWVTDGHE
jgi:hypothetical protein